MKTLSRKALSIKAVRGWAVGLIFAGLVLGYGVADTASPSSTPPFLDYPYVDTYLDYRVYDLPARVVFTQRFGGWIAGEQRGLHRLIVTDAEEPLAAEHHLLYLQWVCQCPEGVVFTIPVSELNRAGPFIYTRPDVAREGQTPHVTFKARNTLTGDMSEVRVFATRIGGYRVEYLTPGHSD